MAWDCKRLHTWCSHGGVFGLAVQVLQPILLIMLIKADNLKPLKFATCRDRPHTLTKPFQCIYLCNVCFQLKCKNCRLPFYQKAQKHFCGFHSPLKELLSFHSKAACPVRNKVVTFSFSPNPKLGMKRNY